LDDPLNRFLFLLLAYCLLFLEQPSYSQILATPSSTSFSFGAANPSALRYGRPTLLDLFRRAITRETIMADILYVAFVSNKAIMRLQQHKLYTH
jgi:hypothetical protein